MNKVFVSVELPEDSAALEVDFWEGPGDISAQELASRVADADVLVSAVNVPVTADVIGAAANLRLIANVGDGYSNIDLPAAQSRGIAVTNAPGTDSIASTAEQTVTLLLALSRRVLQGDQLMRAEKFTGWEVTGYVGGHQVYGKKVLIIGMGRVGRVVAQMLSGFAVQLRYVDPVEVEAEFATKYGMQRVSLDDGLPWADYITVNADLTPTDEFLIDAPQLAAMQKSAYLINCARGPLVREEALVEALRTGQIAGAALDVYEHEPHVAEALTQMDNVVLTPHAGNATVEARHEMARDAAQNVIAFAAGTPLHNVVE